MREGSCELPLSLAIGAASIPTTWVGVWLGTRVPSLVAKKVSGVALLFIAPALAFRPAPQRDDAERDDAASTGPPEATEVGNDGSSVHEVGRVVASAPGSPRPSFLEAAEAQYARFITRMDASADPDWLRSLKLEGMARTVGKVLHVHG